MVLNVKKVIKTVFVIFVVVVVVFICGKYTIEITLQVLNGAGLCCFRKRSSEKSFLTMFALHANERLRKAHLQIKYFTRCKLELTCFYLF